MQADKEQIVSLLGSRQEFYNNMTHELLPDLEVEPGGVHPVADDADGVVLDGHGHGEIDQHSVRIRVGKGKSGIALHGGAGNHRLPA